VLSITGIAQGSDPVRCGCLLRSVTSRELFSPKYKQDSRSIAGRSRQGQGHCRAQKGVLIVMINKKPEAKPRQIDLKGS
jgi:hypothetical protein